MKAYRSLLPPRYDFFIKDDVAINNHQYYVGIGASAGGQTALREFLDHLPSDTGASFFIVTHLSKDFNSRLNQILQPHTRMPIIRVTESMPVQPNTIYLLIENTFMQLGEYGLTVRKRGESMNRAIDVFFLSLAEQRKNKAIGVILSGVGSDGLAGAQKITQNGGKVLVQDPGTSTFDGMPEAIIRNDHPIAIQPPGLLAKDLVALLGSK